MPIINRQSALRAFDARTTALARRRSCPIPGCDLAISARFLMCPAHWARVPSAIQRRVYQAWRSLNADNTDESVQEYRAAKDEAIRFASPNPHATPQPNTNPACS